MKKLILSILASLALLLAPATAFASSGSVDVSGTVYYQGKHVGKNVQVTVTCYGKKTVTKTTKTNKHGQYDVTFKAKDCPAGSTITVSVTYQGHVGTASGTVDKHGRCHRDLDVKIPVTVTPEYGSMAAVGATLTSAGAFLVVRRRQLRGTQS